jgi:hypothetical protein
LPEHPALAASLPKTNSRCKRAPKDSPPGLRTNSVKGEIHTISGFCGNDPGDLKWLGDEADSRIAPETCGPLSPQKSIREQALAAHTSGISHGRDEVGADFHGSTAGDSSDAANVEAPPLAFPMTVDVI